MMKTRTRAKHTHRATLLRTVLLLALWPMVHALAAQPELPRRTCLPNDLREVSGLYYAGPDSLWWHNDSGDTPTLYLTDGRGRIRQHLHLPVRHVDWEDITADNRGHLFIGDFGNNRSNRQDLCIYRYHPATGALDSIRFHYPDQVGFPPADERSFDMEAFFWHRDTLHLFSKDRLHKRGPQLTRHYVLPATPGTYTATLRDSLALPKRVVTGAAIDTTSGTVAFIAYRYRRLLGIFPTSAASVFLFTDYPDGHYLRGQCRIKHVSRPFATQYESIDFISPRYLYIASERTLFIKPKAKRVRWSSDAKPVRP